MVLSGCIITGSDDMIIDMIGMGDVAAGLVLAVIGEIDTRGRFSSVR